MYVLFLIVMMVAAVSGAASTDPQSPPKITNLPLLKNNNNNGLSNSNSISNKIPKSRSVSISSRYMSSSSSTSTSTSTSSSNSSSSSSRRYPSPLVLRNSPSTNDSPNLALKRSASVGRRRQPPPDPGKGTDVSAAAKLLVTSSRSLSVSFQGEAFPLAVSKSKVAPNSPRKGRILGSDQVENSKPSDRHRWPGRNRMASNSNALSRSLNLDCGGIGGAKGKANGSGNGQFRDLQPSMIDDRRDPDGNSVNNEASDTDSVSSSSTAGVQECGGVQNGANGILVSARFWQETNRRLRRLQDPGSPLVTTPTSKLTPRPKSRRFATDSPLSPSPRMASCPIRGGIRPASPGKVMTPAGSSPSRGQSPPLIRNTASAIAANSFCETPSVLSYVVDVRRGKVGENKMIDGHLLRLLHNRHLQWRFVNARSEAASLVQKRRVEKNLWNVWITISDLRDCLTKKRHRLQLLRQKLKLVSILKGQMTLLVDWASLDKDHSISLVGAIEALKASTLRLPVVRGAITNMQSLQDAIGSAVDIMQAMASSLSLLLPLVDEVNILASELAKATRKERDMLQQCTDFISRLAAMQVKGSSLRTHILQHNRTTTPSRHDLSG